MTEPNSTQAFLHQEDKKEHIEISSVASERIDSPSSGNDDIEIHPNETQTENESGELDESQVNILSTSSDETPEETSDQSNGEPNESGTSNESSEHDSNDEATDGDLSSRQDNSDSMISEAKSSESKEN